MKKVFLISLLLLFLFECSKIKKDANIITIQTEASDRINEFYFFNGNNGFAIGGDKYDNGDVLRTNDGGNSWHLLDTSEIHTDSEYQLHTLYSIDFLNDSIGEIVGQGGKILRTEDGGKKWFYIQTGRWDDFRKIKMFSPSKTLLVSDSYLYNSTDFWYYFDIEKKDFTLRDIEFTDNNTAYLAGYGFVKKTIDATQTWKTLNIKGDFFYDICFINKNIGFICGWQGGIYKTTDAGENWQKLHPVNSAFSKRFHFEKIDFYNENIGAVAAYNGQVLYTKDSGKTWQTIQLDDKLKLHSLKFLSENKIIVGSEDGFIYLINL